MSERRSMIEDYIPVVEISAENVREKLGGHRISKGMPRNIHLWWARRPLAAARAAIYATFAPPARDEERERLGEFFVNLCHWTGPVLPDRPALHQARELVSKAAGGERPVVLDMFAGGGAIPLEALRLGAEAVAVELNPVAHLIELCTLVYPQKYGKKLRDAVEEWGKWVIGRTKERVGDLYPDIEVEDAAVQDDLFRDQPTKRVLRPIAYLWTRTVPSPAPGYEKGQVPLVRQTRLRKKKGRYAALRPIVDRAALRVTYEVVESAAASEEKAIEEWGFDPAGMSVRGATMCPYSGTPVTNAYVKKQGRAGKLSEQLLAVACVEPGRRGKSYIGWAQGDLLLPNTDDIQRRLGQLIESTGISSPNEAIQDKDRMNFKVPLYGLDTFGKIFTPRQTLLLLTLCHQVRRCHEEVCKNDEDRDFADAVAACLGLLVGRVADRGSSLCRWDNSAEKTSNTFPRQALPMVWDFSEACPFGGASGDATLQLGYILDVLDHAAATAPGRPARAIHGRAQKLPLEDASVDAVITDPPYYDNISYADLSDFFYVWHKRALGDIFPALYTTPLTPKKPEAIAAAHRHGKDHDAASQFYEEQMRLAFEEAHRVLKPEAALVAVYAHKTTLGWSTLVDSLRRAGFQITEAWPLDTEMPDRAGQMNTASLASSIFLVARKRARGSVGSYATAVRPEMARIVGERVRDLMAAGLGGADLVIAAIGAGLRPFTRHDRVELPNGEELPADRFLDEVQREVLETILTAVFDMDRSGVGQVDKASRFYVLSRYQYGAALVPFGELNTLAQGLGIELSGPGSLADGGSRLVEIKKSKARVLGHEERGAPPELGLPRQGLPAPLIDVLHRLLWLLEHDRAAISSFLLDSRVDPGGLRLLAQALAGRALAGGGGGERSGEQKAIDRLLAQWQRLVEATPLFHAVPSPGGSP